MQVASLVLGIVGIIFSFVPCLGAYALWLVVPGLVLGLWGLWGVVKANKGKGPEDKKAGFGLGLAGVILCFIGTIIAWHQYQLLKATVEGVDEISKAVEQASAEINEIKAGAEKVKAGAEKLQEVGVQIDAAKIDAAAAQAQALVDEAQAAAAELEADAAELGISLED